MSKRKIIIRVSLFFLIFIVIFTYLSLLVYPKDNNTEYEWNTLSPKGILSEKENTIDIIVLGNSEADTSFNNIELYNEYGITSYGLGSPAQKVYEAVDYLNLTLKKQQPKYALIEANFMFTKVNNVDVVNNKFENVFPILRYHHRMFNLNKNDFLFKFDYSYNNIMKGYRFLSGSCPPKDLSRYMSYTDSRANVYEANINSLNKLISKCVKNDIIPILYNSPSVLSWNYSRHNTIADYAKKKNIEYIDLNIDNQANIDWSTDTKDYGEHINYFGAIKVTQFFGEYFLSKGVQSHKGELGYEKWDESVELYKEEMSKIGFIIE